MNDFACFDTFRYTAFRLETFQAYDVPDLEADRIAAWREHRPMPERSPRTNPFLRKVADSTAEGKRWSRIHVVDVPLSEYLRYEMVAYQESARAGEHVSITERRANPELATLRADFWLFDADTPHTVAMLMEYAPGGEYLGAEVTRDRAVILGCVTARDLAARYAVPLDAYLGKETQVA